MLEIDRKLLDKLGIEEKHEYLQNVLPLYRKISLAVIPPLASLDILGGGFSSSRKGNKGADEEDLFVDAPESPSNADTSGGSRDLDGEDVASPVSEEHPSTSFLNQMTMASVYAGVGHALNFKKILADARIGLNESRSHLTGYNWSDSESDSEPESEQTGDDEQSRKPFEENTGSAATSTYQELEADDDDEKANKGEKEIPILSSYEPVISTDTWDCPPEKDWTPWQASVMKTFDPAPIKEIGMVKHEDKSRGADETEQERRDRRKLMWQVAQRAKDVFKLDSTDELYSNYDSWLIKDILLQGQIWLTKEALCFYALSPGSGGPKSPLLTDQEKADVTLYEGALSLRLSYGESLLNLPGLQRFWAVLRPDTLSIYTSPTDMYFPVKVVDLHDALYCEILKSDPTPAAPTSHTFGESSSPRSPRPRVAPTRSSTFLEPPSPASPSHLDYHTLASETEAEETKSDLSSGMWFKIVCKRKSYRFQTGNLFTARHWYNSITKAIFKLHNTNLSDEVLHKIPLEYIVDYQKNFILADDPITAQQTQSNNPTPITISVKYKPPQGERKLRVSRKKKIEPPAFENTHFVIFHDGDAFFDAFSRLVKAKKETMSSSEVTESTQLSNSDSHSLPRFHYTHPENKIISTLQPEVASSRSLSNKIMKHNEHLLLEQLPDDVTMERPGDFADDSEISTNSDGNERLRSMAKVLGINKKIFKRSPSSSSLDRSSSASSLRSGTLQPESLSAFNENSLTLQLPKPFSVLILQSLGMLLVTNRRSMEDVERRLRALYASQERENVSSLGLASPSSDLYEEGENDEIKTDGIQSKDLSSPKKKSRFKNWKKSLRTVSSMGGVWTADPEHFTLKPDGHDDFFVKDAAERERSERHYREHFSLNDDAKLVASYYCHLKRSIPLYGKLYLGNNRLCFRSLVPGSSTHMIVPLKDVDNCSDEGGFRLNYFGLVVSVNGLDRLTFEFGTEKNKDDLREMMLGQLELLHENESWVPKPHELGHAIELTDKTTKNDAIDQRTREASELLADSAIRVARLRHLEDRVCSASGIEFPLVLEQSLYYSTEIKPSKSYRFVLLTIGSRGDVQPYIALGKGLLAEGHTVTIATHLEFKDWIELHDLEFREIAGNPAELMNLMVTHGSMTVSFLREAKAKFKGWINELLQTSWEACKDADVLIESPSAMSGLHIAEALGIPYLRAFTMPWTRTRAYPHAFIVPDQKRGGSYNLLTHIMFENAFWKGISTQVNRWRVKTLGLRKTSMEKMQQQKIPFLYNISPAMFPPAVDFPDWVKVTGYWFLNEGDKEYHPPKELTDFIARAKKVNKKIVYIGFGSIVVKDAKKLTKAIVQAVEDADLMCILNRGWFDRLNEDKDDKEDKDKESSGGSKLCNKNSEKKKADKDAELPDSIYDAGSVPHDWLFPQMDAAVHHGGSGTTGATLRAGTPTIIKPFFGDQFFYASRVEDLGVGMGLKKLNTSSLAKALKQVTTDPRYAEKAGAISHMMEHETGVKTAIAAIYSELSYSYTLMNSIRLNTDHSRVAEDRSGAQTPTVDEEEPDIDAPESGDVSKDQSEAESDDEDEEDDDEDEDDLAANHKVKNNARLSQYVNMMKGQKTV